MSDRTATRIDKYVGERVRQRRYVLGMSQLKLAESLDLSMQQIQKYEKGVTRISAGRLFSLSKILDVPITYFFEDAENSSKQSNIASKKQRNLSFTPSAELLHLSEAYSKIKNPEIRKSVLKFIATFPNEDEGH